MRIISQFQDYYDSALAYGHDKENVYMRKTEEYSGDALHDNETLNRLTKSFNLRMKYFRESGSRYRDNKKGIPLNDNLLFGGRCRVLFFCGEVIPYIEFYINVDLRNRQYDTFILNGEEHDAYDGLTYHAYCEKDIQKFFTTYIKDNLTKAKYEKIMKKSILRKKHTWYSESKHYHEYSNSIHVFIETLQQWKDEFADINVDDLFFEVNSPIIDLSYSNGHKLVTNQNLKDISFFRYLDAYQTFSKIDMFLSGVLGNTEKDIIDISDKDMRDSKGFDKWSFKRRKQK